MLTHGVDAIRTNKNVTFGAGAILEEDGGALVIVLNALNPLTPLDGQVG